jgi:hypothetical protein
MADMKEGCTAAVAALARDGALDPGLTEAEAADLLWTLLSVPNWESLTQVCGWDHARYVAQMQETARRVLMA